MIMHSMVNIMGEIKTVLLAARREKKLFSPKSSFSRTENKREKGGVQACIQT